MKKLFFVFIILFVLLPHPGEAAALTQKLSGRILLQVSSYGRAWYINPRDGTRYYLQDGQAAYQVMRNLGLGISNADLAKIPKEKGEKNNTGLTRRLAGRILLQVEDHGEAWYINPVDGLRYYLKDGEAAYNLMRTFGLGVNDVDLKAIPVNQDQVVFDPTFKDIAYIQMRNNEIIASKFRNQILPLASLSKLMTALVLLDQPSFDETKEVTITQEQLDYPKTLVGNDATSEVDLKAGDIVAVHDLWIAMLVASSNQSAIALVDASGLTRSQFVEAMNKKAVALGLKRTIFYDPTGLDAHNLTTAYEMAKIAEAAFSRTKISDASKQDGYVITTLQTPARTIKVVDRNYSLQTYNPDAAKTGYLVEAKVCVALKKGEDVIVVMHAPHIADRNKILNTLLPKTVAQSQ